jgi:ESS family glutamate:Na+ symporter
MLLETGFAGGHGTAAAMGEVFAKPSTANRDLLILDSGLDLGIMMATIGLVYGILSGVFWVNVGVRKGWTRRSDRNRDDQEKRRLPGCEISEPQHSRHASDSMDALLMQAVWLVLAMTVGGCMQWAVGRAAGNFDGASSIVDSFPLFIYTLLGGWIVRKILTLIGAAELIDSKMVGRISASAMDVLVVAAMASLSLSVLSGNLGGIVVLLLVAAAWTSFCLVWLSKRILPRQHWFELGLINYGMSTGTTATGFVLLRLVDPDLESGAAEDYALAAPISSPFIGGGMITIAMPVLVLQSVSLPTVVLVLAGIMAALIYWGIQTARGQQENAGV